MDYFRHPAVQHYLIVRTNKREVIHHRRISADEILSRPMHVGMIRLDPPGIEIASRRSTPLPHDNPHPPLLPQNHDPLEHAPQERPRQRAVDELSGCGP